MKKLIFISLVIVIIIFLSSILLGRSGSVLDGKGLIKSVLKDISITVYTTLTFFDNEKQYHLDLVSADLSDSVQNLNKNSIITIKSNLGNMTVSNITYIDKNKGKTNFNCSSKPILHKNRTLGEHLRSYLLFVNEINDCTKNSILSRITLKLNCAREVKVFSTYCSNKDYEFVEIFLPGYNSYIPNEYNKNELNVVIPYIGISQYYSGIIYNNNYSSNKLFIKPNTELAIKMKQNLVNQTQFHSSLFYFIESINKWASENNLDVNYIYDFDLNNIELDNVSNLVFPYHSEYLDVNFLKKLINYEKEKKEKIIKILSLSGANFFRPVTISADSSIFYTKTPSETTIRHLDKLKELCIPYYRGNFCDEVSQNNFSEINNNKLRFNNNNYFPICGDDTYLIEEILLKNNIKQKNINWSIYGGEYSKTDCDNYKSLIKIKVNNNSFDLLTTHKTKNLYFFNANTNGMGINLFTSEIATKFLDDFINNN